MTAYTRDQLVNLSGAYALNALDADETLAFEAGLTTDDQTRYEVTELRDTAVLLGLAVAPVQPSAGLRANIMAQLDSLPQRPAEEPNHEITHAETIREFEAPSRAEAKAKARWFARPVTLITSAAAVLVLIVGGVAVVNGVTSSQSQYAVAAEVNQITTASDSNKIEADVITGGTATVIWSDNLATAAVKATGLDVLPGSKTYELWYIGDDGARPAGTFSTASDGSALTVLSGTMQKGDSIGVSVEPAGGSKAPTTVVAAVATA